MRNGLVVLLLLCPWTGWAELSYDGMIAIKSNKPDTIIQVRKEITSEGKVTQLWINIGTTSKDGSYLLLKMPVGVHRIKLSKDGYLPIITNITVDKKINKIEYELDKEMNDINIIFLHEGWQVYVDGNPYLDDDKPVFAPASIMVSKEKHEIRLVKGGFNDIVKRINGEDTVEIKDEPIRGKSTIKKKKEIKETKKENTTNFTNSFDFENYSIEQWNNISGITVIVSSKSTLDTKINIDETHKFAIVPNPDDRWASSPDPLHECNYRGLKNYPHNGKFTMALCYKVNNFIEQYGVTKGTGRLILFANDNKYDDNRGNIRVKLVPIPFSK